MITESLILNSVTANNPALRGSQHMQALLVPQYKRRLIEFLQKEFLSLACKSLSSNATFILDCLGSVPAAVSKGVVTAREDRKNSKGEADNAIFLHTMKSVCNNIIVVANDTDLTMYAALETGHFKISNTNKNVRIEKEIDTCYISINKALDNFISHESVNASSMKYCIGHAVLAIYLLAGTDYISNVFGITCEQMITVFKKYIDFISPLILLQNETFDKVNDVAFCRLLICIYLDKYKTPYFTYSIIFC